ncbi:MAG: L,D-transpeptidase/peptidoglycan binding protein [Actinomycetota bacterium]|nr:L,D-transpeptidase/peptidoglycan binding protein [Actinomycetota bacterium]
MPKLPIIALILLVAVLVCGAGLVYAYDSGREDAIARGVRVGSVDVGGLRAGQAAARVRRELLAPLQRPLLVRAGERVFPLSAREAHIRANVTAMVAEAVRRSREGNVVSRTWRALTGGELRARITPRIGYSRRAVQRLVDKVRVAMSRPAVDARVDFATTDLALRHSRTGRTVNVRRLRALVQRRLLATSGERTVRAKIVKVKPRVTADQLTDRYPVVVTIDRPGHTLRLFERLKLVRSYPIALGQAGLETPAGLYHIQNKEVNPAWHVPTSSWAGSLAGQVIPGGAPNNPLKARWLGVAAGVGVHGTSDRGSIGTNASHGCIRMFVEDVVQLYDKVPVGSPVYIA